MKRACANYSYIDTPRGRQASWSLLGPALFADLRMTRGVIQPAEPPRLIHRTRGSDGSAADFRPRRRRIPEILWGIPRVLRGIGGEARGIGGDQARNRRRPSTESEETERGIGGDRARYWVIPRAEYGEAARGSPRACALSARRSTHTRAACSPSPIAERGGSCNVCRPCMRSSAPRCRTPCLALTTSCRDRPCAYPYGPCRR